MGRFLFIMGLRMMGTLVGWWIYELTNDPFAIGLIGLIGSDTGGFIITYMPGM
jgi:flavin-dependent dehydrogenase